MRSESDYSKFHFAWFCAFSGEKELIIFREHTVGIWFSPATLISNMEHPALFRINGLFYSNFTSKSTYHNIKC